MATAPTIDDAGFDGLTTRAVPGPDTIVCPLRDRIAARRGAWVRRVSAAPGPSPGNTRFGAQSTWSSFTGTCTTPRIVPKMRVWYSTEMRVSCSFTTRMPEAVAVFAVVEYAARKAASVTRFLAAGVSSEYMRW